MSKSHTKRDIIDAINKADITAIYYDLISKLSPDTAKRSQEQTFAKEARKFIAENRDVILIALRIK